MFENSDLFWAFTSHSVSLGKSHLELKLLESLLLLLLLLRLQTEKEHSEFIMDIFEGSLEPSLSMIMYLRGPSCPKPERTDTSSKSRVSIRLMWMPGRSNCVGRTMLPPPSEASVDLLLSALLAWKPVPLR